MQKDLVRILLVSLFGALLAEIRNALPNARPTPPAVPPSTLAEWQQARLAAQEGRERARARRRIWNAVAVVLGVWLTGWSAIALMRSPPPPPSTTATAAATVAGSSRQSRSVARAPGCALLPDTLGRAGARHQQPAACGLAECVGDHRPIGPFRAARPGGTPAGSEGWPASLALPRAHARASRRCVVHRACPRRGPTARCGERGLVIIDT